MVVGDKHEESTSRARSCPGIDSTCCTLHYSRHQKLIATMQPYCSILRRATTRTSLIANYTPPPVDPFPIVTVSMLLLSLYSRTPGKRDREHLVCVCFAHLIQRSYQCALLPPSSPPRHQHITTSPPPITNTAAAATSTSNNMTSTFLVLFCKTFLEDQLRHIATKPQT